MSQNSNNHAVLVKHTIAKIRQAGALGEFCDQRFGRICIFSSWPGKSLPMSLLSLSRVGLASRHWRDPLNDPVWPAVFGNASESAIIAVLEVADIVLVCARIVRLPVGKVHITYATLLKNHSDKVAPRLKMYWEWLSITLTVENHSHNDKAVNLK